MPSGRAARLFGFGGLVSGLAGGVAYEGARRLAAGERPRLGDLLITPANAARLAGELARMRGAAMKVGQLLSMEAADLLPPEIAQVLARLRADAEPLPPHQLKRALAAAWGPDFLTRFERFDIRPIAAASIGQVHRARTRDGRDLAIKVQYPGVRRSIDADIANIATLLRLSGMVPRRFDLAPLLEEARRQLHEEADYAREAAQLARFGALLAEAAEFVVPAVHADLSGAEVLAMDYVASAPIESLETAPQAVRDAAARRLFELFARELFEFRLVQTDANFANFRIAPDADSRIVLLDFGATRAVPAEHLAEYRALADAARAADPAARRAGLRAGLGALGAFGADTDAAHVAALLVIAETAAVAMARPGLFDFGADPLLGRLRAAGMALAAERDFWHAPPADVLFVQRKLAGLVLLATRLGARVDLRAILERALAKPAASD